MISAYIANLIAGGVMRWIAIAAIVAVIGCIGMYIHSAEKAKGRAAALEYKLADTLAKMALNDAAIAECVAVNDLNAQEAIRQAENAERAMARVIELQAETEQVIRNIRDEAEALRGLDTECRTLDDPLPRTFTAGLRE